ncbi:hypothetical protein [Zavarzinia aquatilis]|uniref:Uncharacterized protein n=1 Tax=Zavarzinia aquatilis TaxID=2211142 RepID=A0A317DVE1_9PROT|nr:hypothetical protein [Zavarzinia aquatilis]PWR18521.1 hypothetical protein DKG74_19080 [Zavarzinia aquatilis]
MKPDTGAAVALTLLQIETMRREIQASMLDTMMTANRQYLEQQLDQDDFIVANEIARLLKETVAMAGDIAAQLRQSTPQGAAPTTKTPRAAQGENA